MNSEHYNQSFEPMDIDLSAHSNNDMDISFNEPNNKSNGFVRSDSDKPFRDEEKNIEDFLESINEREKLAPSEINETPADYQPSQTIIKKFHINVQKRTSTYSGTKVKVACTALVLIVAILAYQILNIQCSDDINTFQLRKVLSHKLYGQMEAIDGLIDGLSANERIKLLILYGSTGVGKTFAASMLLEHVGRYSNVYHYTMPSFMNTFTTDFMVALTLCRHSIIIVDDLTPEDVQVKVNINNLIAKSQHLERNVTILLIYNCDSAKDFKSKCDSTFPSRVMDNFKQIKAYKKLIRFETLLEDHLRKCIEAELGHRKVSDEQFGMIMKNFDVSVDGCKGVHSKMKLLDIS